MRRAPNSGLIVAVLAAGGIVVSLMQTLLVPILPELPSLLHTSEANASWAVTSTLLAAAVGMPVFGRLGDMYGKRRVLLACAVLMIIGSVMCALTSSLWPMVAGRALQGLSGAVIPLGISVMRDTLPAEKLASSVALMSASLGVGGALGLPAAALIAQHANWHVLFWVSAALGAVVTVLVPLTVPESPNRAGGRLDVPGIAGLAAGLVALLLAITEGGTWGWTDARTLGCFAGAVVVLLVWGAWELRVPAPLADLRTSARRQVLITNLASIVVGFGMYASQLIAPQVLEMPVATGYGLGQSMVATGMWMLPAGLVMIALSPVTGRLIGRYGAKVPMLAGALVLAAGYGIADALLHHAWGIMIGMAVIGGGIGLAYAAMPSLIMAGVPVSETAAANGLNSLMRSIGTSLASAVMGAILAHMTVRMGGFTLPSQNGFRTGLLVGGGGALVAALVVLAIPRQRPASAPAPAASQPGPAGPEAGATAPADGSAPDDGPRVFGRVRRPDGTPLAGAALTLIAAGGRQAGLAAAGPDGGYRIGIAEPGDYTLIAHASGYRPHAAAVRGGTGAREVDVLLAGASGLTGTVRSAGGPVPDARVTLLDFQGNVSATAATGPDGSYAFDDVAEGEYTVIAAGYPPAASTLTVRAGASHAHDVTLSHPEG